MSPPMAKKCYFTDCDYMTTQGIPNYELVIKDLEMHIKCVHAIEAAGQRDSHGGVLKLISS